MDEEIEEVVEESFATQQNPDTVLPSPEEEREMPSTAIPSPVRPDLRPNRSQSFF